MRPEVVVLNGGSSSGKSTLATCLQQRLDGAWLAFGIDDLIRALSHGPRDTGAGGTLEITSDGSVVVVGGTFRLAEATWYQGLAAMARAGTGTGIGIGIVIDEVFLSGGESQARLRTALDGLPVLWVGVVCDPAVAAARERARADRTLGMARDQAERVHRGVSYDVVVDTSATSPDECASTILSWITDHDS